MVSSFAQWRHRGEYARAGTYRARNNSGQDMAGPAGHRGLMTVRDFDTKVASEQPPDTSPIPRWRRSCSRRGRWHCVVRAAVSEFIWRYRLPVVELLAPAAALAGYALGFTNSTAGSYGGGWRRPRSAA
jgi:hypothetical protein